MRGRILIFFGLAIFAGVFTASADIQYAGVNLSGAEFGQGNLPGTFNTDYTYPTTGEVDYYKSKGMNFIRLPFRWERLQHTNSAPLDPAELGRMNSFVSYATAHGMYVLLDPHNFQRYYPDPANFQSSTNGLVGSAVPNSDFSNFWFQVADIYQTNNHVFFGLNNEPNAVPETQLVTSENVAIAAIRASGATNLIFVPGTSFTGAWTWSNSNGKFGAANSVAMLGITDPDNNFLFEVHQYLDSDGSGTHTTIVSADVGWQRLTNFTAWARLHDVKGFLGEYAVPGVIIGGSGIGGAALTNMLAYISTNSDVWEGWAYWGGGPWWGSTPLFPIDPVNISNPTDQPVMSVIKHFFPLPVPTLQVVSGNQFQFIAPQGFMYQPQFSTNLVSNSWENYGNAITGSVQTITMNLSNGPSAQGFYRVQVNHAP